MPATRQVEDGRRVAGRPGLYAHVPFCTSGCPGCEFLSVSSLERVPFYLGALEREAALAAGRLGPFDSLYIGGGTPSCLAPEDLERLFEALRRRVHFIPGCEVTVEVSPADASDELLERLAGVGVNRIHLSVVSFDDATLKFLRRRHSARDAARAIERVQRRGSCVLSLDLVHGTPDPLDRGLLVSLRQALTHSPDHVCCFGLNASVGEPFALPDKGCLASTWLYRAVCVTLARAGFEHYETACFARDPALRCRHNRKVWQLEIYLGLGPGAHSFDGTSRWWNLRRLDAWLDAVAQGLRPMEGFEVLQRDALARMRLAQGLRLADGIELGVVRNRNWGPALVERLLSAGLARLGGGRLRPTELGMLHAEGIARMLT